jgi:hypothetical protein
LAATDDDFHFLLAAARRLLGEISEEIASRRSDGKRGEVLADHVTHALEAIAARIDEEEERYPDRHSEAAKKAGARELRLYTQLVWGTHCSLLWLHPDEKQLLDLGALYFADEIALALLGPGVEVTPVESSDYMYSTSSWPFDWLLEDELGEKVPDGPRPIVLAFPAHARYTMLLHCLFAHELSHPAVEEKGLIEAALRPLKDSGDYDAMLNDAASRTTVDLQPLVLEGGPKLATLWLEELFCDALAFALLGPAYLFAFAEMGLSVGWSKSDDEHPSMALRTLLLVKFAKRHGWSTYLDARLPKIWQWLEFAAAGPSTVPGTIGSFAERVCRNSLTTILDLVEGSVGDRQFTAPQWEDREDHFAELLDNDILPVEDKHGVAARHHEILLASWLQALDEHDKEPSAIPRAIGEIDYHRFVAKALEMSTTLRVWTGDGIG